MPNIAPHVITAELTVLNGVLNIVSSSPKVSQPSIHHGPP